MVEVLFDGAGGGATCTVAMDLLQVTLDIN